MDDLAIVIDYVNWKGERGMRRIIPRFVHFGSNQWHPEPQWLLSAFDLGKGGVTREFALLSIKGIYAKDTENPGSFPTISFERLR